jgi:O-antigen ligase
MLILKYIVLILFICNIPSIVLISYGNSAGSLLSYSSFVLLIIYYFLSHKSKPVWPFIIFALSYFTISGLIGVDDEKYYFIDFLKYLLVIICGGQLVFNTKLNELIIIIAIGVSSILFNVLFFPTDYGRYSGFYMDPNSAGFASLIGFALCFGLKNQKWKLIGHFFFTFCGILTFSRTFLLLWFILIIISIFQNKKNFKILGIGIATILLLFSVNQLLKLNSERFNIIDSIVNKGQVNSFTKKNPRTETWSLYYDLIANSPIVGSGYKTFTSDVIHDDGVHNNYLRILGESGIFPFLLFAGIYFYILYQSIKFFKSDNQLFLLSISLIGLHLTNHNFDTLYYIALVSMWLYFKVCDSSKININNYN